MLHQPKKYNKSSEQAVLNEEIKRNRIPLRIESSRKSRYWTAKYITDLESSFRLKI